MKQPPLLSLDVYVVADASVASLIIVNGCFSFLQSATDVEGMGKRCCPRLFSPSQSAAPICDEDGRV